MVTIHAMPYQFCCSELMRFKWIIHKTQIFAVKKIKTDVFNLR